MASKELAGLRTAIYARFSSEGQRESSIEDQVRRCREFIEIRGGTVSEELVFVDRALSGAGADRPAFEAMLELVDGRRRRLDAIVFEDLSRLSRSSADLFDIERRVTFASVRLLGVADGIDTFAKHSTLTYGVKTLLSSIYLADLRDKTLRGLEGRALAGMATGGVAYGYRLRKEFGPGGVSIGTQIEINDEQADVVRRIFQLYLEGQSLAGIAKTLNVDSVPPPRVHVTNRRVGWKDSTIRAILHNESYIGCWRYKARQWRKVPGTNRRVPFRNDEGNSMPLLRPHLRIIDEQVWRETQIRLEQVRRFYTVNKDGEAKGRAVPGRATPYLFSSLLRCGVCSGKMVISGGSSEAYYRCEGYAKRGVCTNALSVRESTVRACLLDELRQRLVMDEGIAYARKKLAERLGEVVRERDAELIAHRQRFDKAKREAERLVDFVVQGVRSETIAERLTVVEKEIAAERGLIETLERQSAESIPLPTPDEILAIAFDLERRLAADPVRGREELRRLFRDGSITLTPQPDGIYVARSELLPLVLLTKPPSEADLGGREGESPHSVAARYTACSCAGTQRDLTDEQFQSVTECWLPFEEYVAIGWG